MNSILVVKRNLNSGDKKGQATLLKKPPAPLILPETIISFVYRVFKMNLHQFCSNEKQRPLDAASGL